MEDVRVVLARMKSEPHQQLQCLFMMCHPEFVNHAKFQEHTVALDGHLQIISIARDVQYDVGTRVLAFLTLGTICFRNEDTCRKLVQGTDIISIAYELLQSDDNAPRLKWASLNTVSNCAYCAEVHPQIIHLLDRAVTVFHSTTDNPQLCVQIVILLGLLAYNDANRHILKQAGVVDVFRTVLHTNDRSLRPVAGAIALACLLDPSEYTPKDIQGLTNLTDDVVLALEATLAGEDFPRRSGAYYTTWKIVRSVANMCTHQLLRDKLMKLGLIGLLQKTLETSEPKVIEHTLRALWTALHC
eukprot:c19998_g1_i2.p1 GENE.c19998_g1_i2~~c19998_g1_i2.p1  ORF type:complete len:300 (+),score=51.76 c19998_g1_i2:51-950(+)